MAYRLVGHAQDRIDAALFESATRWGLEAADRYTRLVMAAMNLVGDTPLTTGSREVPGVPGVRTLHLRSVRHLLAHALRVGEPRHLVVYRVAPDGVTEVLSLVHDRMLLPGAARRARREADC